MPVTVYKHSDASAPQMTSAAGSLLTVLDACLVDGYGSKAAAGWAKTVIDAGTYQAVYTQGAATGKVQKKLYVKDDAATPGNAIAWACDTCTVAASPTLTNYFWGAGSSYAGVIVKADQNNGGFSKWIVVASPRWAYIFVRRSDWGARGWQMTFIGDLDTPYPNDKGCFTALGFNANSGPAIPLGGGMRAMSDANIGVYGNQDGTYSFSANGFKRFLGDVNPYADTAIPRSAYNSGLLFSRIIVADTKKYRGSLPQIFRTVVSLDNFSWYMLPDEYVIQTPDASRSFMQLQFGGTITGASEPGRIFLELTGAL